MTVRGIEAIKMYMPPSKSKIDANIREERGQVAPTAEKASNNNSGMISSVDRYSAEWRQLLVDLSENPERIREAAYAGELKTRKFRSVYWAILLRVLNVDHNSWGLQCKIHRTRYERLKEEFIRNPHNAEAADDDDPLSQSKQSVWNQYFTDQELFAVIRQDVVRTFPGVDFFRKAVIQDAMTNILFYYACEHPYMSYRQGMHEILAPILFVVYSDHQSLLHLKEISHSLAIDETLLDVLSSEFLEADSYSIFSRVMSSIQSFYRISHTIPAASGRTANQNESSAFVSTEVEVIAQLNSIRDKILAKADIHLYNHLLKLEIPLHLFGIPWLRLLFGREFPLLDLMVLWDAIFADSDRFDLPKYILVAMLVHIRDKLLLQDYTTCLTHLMRYTANVDVNVILRHALHMQMPSKFERPESAIIYGSATGRRETLPAQTHGSGKATVGDVPKAGRQRVPSISDTPKIERHITMMQARNASDEAALDKLKVGPDESQTVMDGYSENSPELLRLELKNAQTVIGVARDKLQKYLCTIRQHVPQKRQSEEFAQALDGIEELCSFLDVKSMFPLHTRARAPIDAATEANEQLAKAQRARTRRGNSKAVTKSPSTVAAKNPPSSGATNDESRAEIAEKQNNFFSAYEKPDIDYRRNSIRLLGQLKEIELLPISTDERVALPAVAAVPLAAESVTGVATGVRDQNYLPLISPFLVHQQ